MPRVRWANRLYEILSKFAPLDVVNRGCVAHIMTRLIDVYCVAD